MPVDDIKVAQKSLLDWFNSNKRDLAWRKTNDPYKIWVSEIMLQQTRVDQATPYYHRFIKRFPDVYELAKAPQDDLLKIWEGLGYYSRARNMQFAANQIVEDFGGKFPDSEKDVRSLKGIGPYTSAAILSIAFGKPFAVVDGNVIRVLSRLAGIEEDVRKKEVIKQIQHLADEFLNHDNPGDHNQAVMELGATICTPKNPKCHSCPLQLQCTATKLIKTDTIPYKSPAKKRPHKHIGVGVIVDDENRLLIAKRPNDVMLGGLWEFPGGKKENDESIEQTITRELEEELGVTVETGGKITEIKHAYSHFTITLHAYYCRITDGEPLAKSSQEIRWVNRKELQDFPFPKANKQLTELLVE